VNPYEQEPAHLPAEDQSLTPARVAATAASALPAVALGMLCLFEGLAALYAKTADCAFLLVRGAALLVLFADVAAVIQHAQDLGRILIFGVLGFVGAFAAVALTELGGPPATTVLVLVAGGWAVAIQRSHRAASRFP